MLRQYNLWNIECVARFRRRGNRPVVISMFGYAPVGRIGA
jgi:hypothetical protein